MVVGLEYAPPPIITCPANTMPEAGEAGGAVVAIGDLEIGREHEASFRRPRRGDLADRSGLCRSWRGSAKLRGREARRQTDIQRRRLAAVNLHDGLERPVTRGAHLDPVTPRRELHDERHAQVWRHPAVAVDVDVGGRRPHGDGHGAEVGRRLRGDRRRDKQHEDEQLNHT